MTRRMQLPWMAIVKVGDVLRSASGTLRVGSTRPCVHSGKTIHPVRLPDGPAQGGLFSA